MPSSNIEEQMKEINTKLEKLKIVSCTKSIPNDLKKKGDMIFSDESCRVDLRDGQPGVDRTETKLRRLFSVLLAWNTYQRDWTWVHLAFGSDIIKIR